MIAIQIGDEFLELAPGSGMQIEDNNPCFMDEFSEDVIQHSYSFPVEAPATPHNNRLLGHANKIDINVNTKVISHDVRVYFGKNPFAKAKLVILSAGKSYSINVKTGLAALNCIDKKLSELDLGGDITMGVSAAGVCIHALNTLTVDFFSGGKYVFVPHANKNFYGESSGGFGSANPDFLGIVNQFHPVTGSFRFNIDNVNTYNLVPWPYLFYVLQQGFKMDGLSMFGTFAENVEMASLLMYNNRALDQKYDTTSVRASSTIATEVYNDFDAVFDDETTTPNRDLAGLWDGDKKYSVLKLGLHSVAFSMTVDPDRTTGLNTEVIVKLLKGAGTVVDQETFLAPPTGPFEVKGIFFFTALIGDVGEEYRLYVEEITEGGTFEPVHYAGSRWIEIHAVDDDNLNQYSRVLNLQRHMPDITFGDLLTALKLTKNLSYTIQDEFKRIYIDFAQDHLDQTVKDQTSISGPEAEAEILFEDPKYKSFNFNWPSADKKTEKNFLKFDQSKLLGVYNSVKDFPPPVAEGFFVIAMDVRIIYKSAVNVLAVDPELGWEFYSDYYYPKEVGTKGTDIKMDCSPLLMNYATLYNGSLAAMPEINELGSSDAFETGENPPTLRLVFYRGFKYELNEEFEYPFATPSAVDSQGNSIGQFEINWHMEAKSLYKLFWERWVQIMNNGQWVRRIMNYTRYELFTSKITDKIRIRNICYLMRKRSIPLSDKIEDVEVELKPLT